jgi:methyl-accepting chemotaxis protein
MTVHSMLVSIAWITNFEALVIGGSPFTRYEVLRWMGGFLACFMMLLMQYIFMEKDIQEYLDIKENYINFRGRILFVFIVILSLLTVSQYSILIGCLGIDSNSLLIFKMIFYTTAFTIPLFIILVKISKSFSDNLTRSTAFLRSAAGKDFTASIAIESRDEFGDLGGSMAMLQRSLSDVIRAAGSASGDINQSAEKMEKSIVSLIGDMENLFIRLIQLSESQMESSGSAEKRIMEMTENIGSIFENIKTQTGLISENSSSIEEKTSNILSIGERTKTASEDANKLFSAALEGKSLIEQTSASIQEIEIASRQIFEFNKMIDSITDQSKMLAMNASIESAHAGEAGKGFAIVASEVRKLSETTSETAGKVNALVQVVLRKVANTLELSDRSKNEFQLIHELINRMKTTNNEIAAAMEEQSAALKNELTAITNLVAVTDDISALSGRINETSRSVKTAISGLNSGAASQASEVRKNSESVRGMIAHVIEIIELNKSIALNLAGIIEGFSIIE